MAAVAVKCRGRGKETDEHVESPITREVHPRVGAISDDFMCDSCLLNSSTDSLKAAVCLPQFLCPLLRVPRDCCRWSGYVLPTWLAECRF